MCYRSIASALFLLRLQQGGALRTVSPAEKEVVTSEARSESDGFRMLLTPTV